MSLSGVSSSVYGRAFAGRSTFEAALVSVVIRVIIVPTAADG